MGVHQTIELNEQIHQPLVALGESRREAPAGITQRAIAAYLDREDALRDEIAEDEVRWSRYVATGAAIPDEEVARWLATVGTDAALPCPLPR